MPRRDLAPVLLLLAACTGSGDTVRPPRPLREEPTTQDVLTTDLTLDLTALTGHAIVVVQPAATADHLWLDVRGLTLGRLEVDGAPTAADVENGILRVAVSDPTAPVELSLDYTFKARSNVGFNGWMPGLGVSFVWPQYCGNLYPCNPWPADGVTVTMEVTGIEDGRSAIYPGTTTSDGPSYMPAVAVGEYTKLDLGTSAGGTRLSAWYLPGGDALGDAQAGTAHLVDVFGYYETTYGPYAFGPEAGTVEVDWGADSWGGMEHHPFFHVAKFDFSDEEAQAHEAAHAWFGDGVRLACWEDFVLSEGTTTYITARAMEQVGGDNFWPYYVHGFLEPICEGQDVNAVVLPDETCNEIDFENDDLWSLAPYMKGACFFEDVADLIGQDTVDAAIASFYAENVSHAARMQDMLDTLQAAADPSDRAELDSLEQEWLRTRACPADYADRCLNHVPR